MNIQECHIDFDIKLQEVSSFKFKKYETQEIDWFLNKSMIEYIKNKIDNTKSIKGGIHDSTTRLDELATIIETVELPLYENGNDESFGLLPTNYLDVINERLNFYDNCKGNLTFETEIINFSYVSIGFDKTKFGSTNSTFEIKINTVAGTTSIFKLSDYYTTGLSVDYLFYLKDIILEEINKNSTVLKVYWERYNNIYKPNKFIFVYNIGVVDPLVSIQFFYITGQTETQNIIGSTLTRTVEIEDTDTKIVECDIMSNETVYRQDKNPFARTNKDSPNLFLKGDKIYVKYNSKFRPKTLTIDYFRMPQLMNYELNRGCEIGVRGNNRAVCSKIVDGAVSYVSMLLSNSNSQFLNQKESLND